MQQSKLVLHFFNLAGRARAIRMAFALGKIPYEDRRYSYDEFEKLQQASALPFGAFPVLDVDGERLAQSRAILRYAGRLAGLYPHDALAAARCDMAIDAMEEVCVPEREGAVPATFQATC
jgi:prostaglandin-H2 D-isomerase / glutathione transferase